MVKNIKQVFALLLSIGLSGCSGSGSSAGGQVNSENSDEEPSPESLLVQISDDLSGGLRTGKCSDPITLVLEDGESNAVEADATSSVSLSIVDGSDDPLDSSRFSFHESSDSDCSAASITSVDIAQGDTSAQVRVLPKEVGDFVIQATISGSSDVASFNVNLAYSDTIEVFASKTADPSVTLGSDGGVLPKNRRI